MLPDRNTLSFLDLEIWEERRKRRVLLDRFEQDLQASLDREASLSVQRSVELERLPKELRVESLVKPEEARKRGAQRFGRGAANFMLELLNTAGTEGMTGAELTKKVVALGFSKPAIERAKQRVRLAREVTLHEGLWRLWIHSPGYLKGRTRA